jgi:uncharacterized damage-inducible protein DinB
MKKYLIDTFKYNSRSNIDLLKAIAQLPQKDEAIKLFSHLVAAQDKWFNRIEKKVEDSSLNWFGPLFIESELSEKWLASVNKWITYLENTDESDLEKYIVFSRATDGKKLKVKLKDLMLQLNYHSIHHRAQINTVISRQGIKPPLTDYIFSVIEEEE